MNVGHMIDETSLKENASEFINSLYHILELPFD